MSRTIDSLGRFGRDAVVATAALWLAAAPAGALDIIINNGSAPPDPANVIDASHSFPGTDDVHVQNIGCDWSVDANCPAPGAPTAVALVPGGLVGGSLYVHETSSLAISGGRVDGALVAYDFSHITLSDGSIGGYLEVGLGSSVTLSGGSIAGQAFTTVSARLTMSGGVIGGNLFAVDSSLITLTGGSVTGTIEARDDAGNRFDIVGRDFAVDGTPVPYGPLAAESGTLTGILQSGDPIHNLFNHRCYVPGSCHITLVAIPEPSTALLLGAAAAALAARRRGRN